VRRFCLEEAMLTPEEYGVWGGLSADERARALHETAALAPVAAPRHPAPALATSQLG
jgi:hypothetical protein